MTHSEKLARVKKMLRQVAPAGDLETLAKRAPAEETLGPEADAQVVRAHIGVRKLAESKDDQVGPDELRGMEAIILPGLRPVVFVRDNIYEPLQDGLWAHLNAEPVRQRFRMVMPSVGRVELPTSLQIPYGGTGFVVGPDLVMTNRHVARLFTEGVGTRRLVYRSGDAAVDFKRERNTAEEDRTAFVTVRAVVMIHPYWDMALMRVDGLPAGVRPLTLSVQPPDALAGRQVAAVGYPARDDRNDLRVQDDIFGRVYNVKRFQPGEARERRRVRSFGNDVDAMTHDSSTLGGNSGSAVIDIETGQVVGLHFAGVYLDANYAVPTYELARDSRVVDAGLNFAGRVAGTDAWGSAWSQANGGEVAGEPARDGTNASTVRISGGTANWTIPIQVSLSIGQPTPTGAPSQVAIAATEARAMQIPKIYPNLKTRAGYQADFLELDDGKPVPLPELTAAGKKVAAELDEGEYELKYHHFSVIMHKKRRLALFTASNVDWQRESREVDGRVPSRRELTEIPDGMAEEWMTDRRISLEHQLPDVFFTKDRTAWDKGHLVRRDDVCWGSSFKDIQKANGDTYHTTNCSPQVAGFNQSARGQDNWGQLENMVQRETKSEKVIVFSGPVLADDDREFQGRDLNGEVWLPVPSRFWKVVVAKTDDGPQAFGFVLEQDFSDVRWTEEEFAVPPAWQRYMQPIADIEGLLFGLVKLTWLKKHDSFDTEEGRRIAERARASG